MHHPALALAWQAAWFDLLLHSRQLDFDARSGPASQMQWNHRGHGSVAVTVDDQDIHFDEHFTLDNGLPCTDRKCWRFTTEGIVFRHWRQQQFQDILLLVPHQADSAQGHHPGHAPGVRPRAHQTASDALPPIRPDFPGATSNLTRPDADPIQPEAGLTPLVARSPYSCPPDLYDGTLMQKGKSLLLSLRIRGSRKDEHIQYRYQRGSGGSAQPTRQDSTGLLSE